MMKGNKDVSPEVVRALNMSQIEIPPIGLEHLLMTDEQRSNMSFNTFDQLFIFQLMQQVADNIKAEQANSIAAQNVLLHTKLENITEGYALFEKNKVAIGKVGDFDNRLSATECTNRKLTWAIFIIIILIILMIVFGPLYHNRYLVFFKSDNQTELIDPVFKNVHEGNIGPTTRAVKVRKLTDAEIDSVIREKEKYMIKPMKNKMK